jgi:hypothetical protein
VNYSVDKRSTEKDETVDKWGLWIVWLLRKKSERTAKTSTGVEKPISLAPLSPEEAMRGPLAVEPLTKEQKPVKRAKKPKHG